MKSGTSFLLGVLVGVGVSALASRIRHMVEEEQPDRVYSRLSDSLEELERKAKSLESRLSAS